jgi:predicted dienelactone hydrolase
MLFMTPIVNPLTMTAFGAYRFCTVPDKSSPNGSESQDRFSTGGYRLKHEKFRLVDYSRKTEAYNRFPGHHARVLKGEIWRPARMEKPGPLVVYSHGFMSSRREGTYLLRFLASRGYTAVAVDHPLTSRFAPDKPLVRDVANQPGDISFVIDTILQRNTDPDDTLFNTIAPDKITAAGLSLGCLTTMLAGFHRELLDTRISAAICIAGPTTMFNRDFFAANPLPTLLIYADMDSICRYEEQAVPAKDMIPQSIMVTLKNASHTGFSQYSSTYMRLLKNPDSLACLAMGRNLGRDLKKNFDYVSVLGGDEVGIVEVEHQPLLKTPLIPVSMKAARQQMFTMLAAHAFLDSLFADTVSKRRASRRYLLNTLQIENSTEVAVSR